MRAFNKIFVVALPRCATVSMSDALGLLGIRTAHLGKIYGEQTMEHNNPERLMRMHTQIVSGDFDLDILSECDGLADYPACCADVVRQLDAQFPSSLFINVRRDQSINRWLQSVERQFTGLQLIKQDKAASEEERAFMKVMLGFREMTFGQSDFQIDAYRSAYHDYQQALTEHFVSRKDDFLEIDLTRLENNGFASLCDFLDCADRMPTNVSFPNSNEHSQKPREVFMTALEEGRITSQTGIQAVSC